ncbi:MAG: YraN family protein [Alphaproteobacteria bacterium]|nr:YraN family protein [Alphaproteobacteria bacterium]
MTQRRRLRHWNFGRRAEWISVLLLRLKGYRIVARDLRTPVGEIDIIARRGQTVAIIEVKGRADLANAGELVSRRQRGRIERAAAWLLQTRPEWSGLGFRYDVMLVERRRWPRHIIGAWRSGD